jgi:hypothetical protein
MHDQTRGPGDRQSLAAEHFPALWTQASCSPHSGRGRRRARDGTVLICPGEAPLVLQPHPVILRGVAA